MTSRVREVRVEEGRPLQSLSEPWVERSLGHFGIVVPYAVRWAKRRVLVALLVDGVNEVDGLGNISVRVPVGKIRL